MSRRNIDQATFDAWAKGEADNRHRRNRVVDHGDGERGFNILGVLFAIVVGLAVLNIPPLFALILHYVPFLKG